MCMRSPKIPKVEEIKLPKPAPPPPPPAKTAEQMHTPESSKGTAEDKKRKASQRGTNALRIDLGGLGGGSGLSIPK